VLKPLPSRLLLFITLSKAISSLSSLSTNVNTQAVSCSLITLDQHRERCHTDCIPHNATPKASEGEREYAYHLISSDSL
jgi:hypothetical protein